MSIRYLAVGYITIMLVMASAVAEEVKIMGLTEKNAALLDGTKSLEYYNVPRKLDRSLR